MIRDDIKIGSNVRLSLRDRIDGEVIDQRESHNIYVDYGREWISEAISYQATLTPFRDDLIRYMAVGIGGTQQTMTAVNIRTLGYAGFADDWDYSVAPPAGLSTGGLGGAGAAGATQTDSDPTVTGLEYPVQVTSTQYYNTIKVPATFPVAGVVRYTSVLGYNDVSFGAFTQVPISEVGLFTSSLTAGVTDTQMAPLDAAESRGPYGGLFYPGAGTRYMIAYNTFPTLMKTSSFVLQIDWELRFS